jgi:hypothetical protein
MRLAAKRDGGAVEPGRAFAAGAVGALHRPAQVLRRVGVARTQDRPASGGRITRARSPS